MKSFDPQHMVLVQYLIITYMCTVYYVEKGRVKVNDVKIYYLIEYQLPGEKAMIDNKPNIFVFESQRTENKFIIRM